MKGVVANFGRTKVAILLIRKQGEYRAPALAFLRRFFVLEMESLYSLVEACPVNSC